MSRYLILYYRPGGAGPWRECPHCTRLLSNSRNLGKSECIYLVLTATSLIHSSRSHSLPRNMKLKVRDLAWPWRGQHHCTTRQLQLQPGQVINCPVSKFWVRSFITDKLLRENYNQYFLLGICPSRLFQTFNEANILLIVYFDNMFDLQSQKLQLESV